MSLFGRNRYRKWMLFIPGTRKSLWLTGQTVSLLVWSKPNENSILMYRTTCQIKCGNREVHGRHNLANSELICYASPKKRHVVLQHEWVMICSGRVMKPMLKVETLVALWPLNYIQLQATTLGVILYILYINGLKIWELLVTSQTKNPEEWVYVYCRHYFEN